MFIFILEALTVKNDGIAIELLFIIIHQLLISHCAVKFLLTKHLISFQIMN